MVDRAKKISELPVATGLANSDLFIVVSNAAGNAVTKQITTSYLASAVVSQVVANASANQIVFVSNNVTVGNANLTFNSNAGILSVGSNLSYNDTGITVTFVGNNTSYVQGIVQNKSTSSTASANWNVSGDTANATHNYGEFGINSSTFTGSDYFSQPSLVYVAAASTPLTLGTYSFNPVSIVTYNSKLWVFNPIGNLSLPGGGLIDDQTTQDRLLSIRSGYDATELTDYAQTHRVGTNVSNGVYVYTSNNTYNWVFTPSGSLKLPNGPTIFTGNATTRADVNTQVGTAGSNGSIYLSTAGKMYLKVSNTGTVTTDWQRVTTTAVD